jgi:1-acyl-sn-glycerol-3-phosphate acyltransferase
MSASLQAIAVSVLWGVLAAGALLAAFLLALVAVGFVVRARSGERLAWDGVVGCVEAVARPVARFIHRTRWVGFDRFRVPEGGFVIVANHASGLDPPLMQFAVPRKVRFMMAKEQMHPALGWLWSRLQVLPVTYTAADAGMLREAVRHVKQGGVVGVFPEGAIERPPCVLAPFADGTGTLVALTKAPVVVLWIHGTPTLGNALLDPFVPRLTPATVEYVATIDFAAEGVREPREITARLRAELARASGWPMRDEAGKM